MAMIMLNSCFKIAEEYKRQPDLELETETNVNFKSAKLRCLQRK
jgi:hypothetical protein